MIVAAIAAAALVAVPAIVSVATVEAPAVSSAAGSGVDAGPGGSHWGPFNYVGVFGGHHKYQDPYGNSFTDDPAGQRCVADINDTPLTATCFDTTDEAASYMQAQGVAAADTSSITDSAGTTTDIGLLSSYSYVLGTLWKDVNYSGSSLTFYGSGECINGNTYGITSMPSGWNDVASSARGASQCWVQVFQNTYYGGANLVCTPNCANFYSRNDQTSSVRFW